MVKSTRPIRIPSIDRILKDLNEHADSMRDDSDFKKGFESARNIVGTVYDELSEAFFEAMVKTIDKLEEEAKKEIIEIEDPDKLLEAMKNRIKESFGDAGIPE